MGDPTMTEQLDLMEQAWSSIDELASSLGTGDWDTATDCPGWTVKDQLSHMAGNEHGLLGRPRPDVEVSGAHLRNPLGESNEKQIEVRRPWPPERVLEDWREVTGERLGVMRSWSPVDWDATTWAPPGEMPRRDALRFRIFDAWVHEQDMRRATGRPGHLRGGVARFSYEMMLAVIPYIVGKKAAAPDGSTVVFDVTGGPASPFAIEVKGKRAAPGAAIPEKPTVRLTMDFETFVCLCCGRRSPERVLADGRASLEGDQELGVRILQNMNYMP